MRPFLRPSLLLPLLVLVALAAACGRPDPDQQLLEIRRWEDRRTLAGDSLLTVLREGTKEMRLVACRAVGRIGDPRGRQALEERLREDDRPEVRREAAFALGILGDKDAAAALARRLDVETEIDALGEVALALGRLGQSGSAEPLHPLLKSRYPQLRERALEALALLADSTSAPHLIEATRDPIESVAWRATYALEKIAGDVQVPRLIELTAPEHPSLVRRYAVRSLGRLGAEQGASPIASLVGEEGMDWRLRVALADALGRIRDTDTAAAVATLLTDPHFHVRVAAIQALGQMEARSQMHLLLDARQDDTVDARAAAYDAIASCLEGRAFDLLRPGLEDPSPAVVATCARRLGESKEADVGETLIALLDGDSRTPVRVGATQGLVAMAERAPLARLRAALTDADWVVAAVAASGLGDHGDEDCIDDLLRASERSGEGSVDIRLAAYESLGKLGDARAIPRLRRALEQDSSSRERVTARDALALLLPEAEVALLPEAETLRKDVRAIERSTEQPDVVARTSARQLHLHTARGRVVIDLFAEDAPQMVESFARLAESGFFDGLDFHRVVPNFVVQGGDPHGSGWGDPGYTLRSEWNPRRYETGTVGIAHSGKDTGGCQLFICLSPQPHLEARYTIFGQVVTGMDVVERLQREDRFEATIVRADGAP